ncbi:NAD(P)H-dependent oxidoreductase [Mesorhizobium sp. B2-3-5]|uniref:NAD(P)H-dependent oxidoreductase n=1 Tax=Mesorhizobium sp. B2-3-5 TaxID=2589958 RepID=UPI001126C4C7|nr:NAD(P)H-dependent oxidoreductase [Mesorhizobium sp. B2-3-5]TPM16333.1 NAD(P)H-dependent oxidoreductase [Mesorhizobium sp. B2-3-5]
MKTLVLMFHPDPSRSKANVALAEAARSVPGVEVVDMQALYPDGRLDMFTDGAVEAARLLGADRLVLQFPVQWYATPPLLRAWQDAVPTRMFYIAYEAEGRRLEGTPILIAATAGNVPEAYTPRGQNLIPLGELLNPLRATAHRCKLPWASPFLIYRADKLTASGLADAASSYATRLSDWAAEDAPACAAA